MSASETTPAPELVGLSEVAARLDRLGFALEPGDEVRDEIFSIRVALISAKFAIEATRAAAQPQGDALDDVARMDWLEARGYPGQFFVCDDGSPTEKWFDSETVGSDYSPTLRAAIDAAMTPPPAELGEG